MLTSYISSHLALRDFSFVDVRSQPFSRSQRKPLQLVSASRSELPRKTIQGKAVPAKFCAMNADNQCDWVDYISVC